MHATLPHKKNLSSETLLAQTLLFPRYKHALRGRVQFVEGHTLLEERERERVSQGEMVGDGTESAICIAVVDAIVLSSLS